MDPHSRKSDDPDQRRALFRHVSKVLIDFAQRVVADTGGYFVPTDAARMLMAAGLATMANAIGRDLAVEYLRSLATALEAGGQPGELN